MGSLVGTDQCVAVSLDELTSSLASRPPRGGEMSLAAAGAALEHDPPWAANSGAKAELRSTFLPEPEAVRVSTSTEPQRARPAPPLQLAAIHATKRHANE